MGALKQLQDLLRDLFQLELADLDFGLYRLFRLKKEEIEAFLTEQLPRRVEEAFQSVTGEQRSNLEEDVSKLAGRIKEEIGEEALLPNGDVKPEFRETKVKSARALITGYETKRQQLQSVKATEAQKAEVFNHLYAFFSRYYEAGDFIPRRRYGARETYAVPYNGEETFFHWANKNQHYVKTGEAFRDYSFNVETLSGPCRLRFILTAASLPPGNTKGDTRFFFPPSEEVNWNAESRTIQIPFHYRLPTEEEMEKRGKNSNLQEAVLQNALPEILNAVPDFTLRSTLAEVLEEKEAQKTTLLLKRMRHFCRRNTTDYFIHRDLEGFLKGELEFYLKDQIIHLADAEGDLDVKVRIIRVIRQLAEEIITFLAQIEEVQKRLFEKKKFVLRADYLIPIKNVPPDLWKDVLENKAQIEAWKNLFAIEPKKDLFNQKGKINEQFIKDHPTLVVDTALFSTWFKEKVLAAFEDIDEATDGILIHSENYQALRFLEQKFEGKVKCIYIDPPYNTGSDEFIYKDRYQHSTWLAMIEERLRIARFLLSETNGTLWINLDDNEIHRTTHILNIIFDEGAFVGNIAWKKTSGDNKPIFAFTHDNLIIYGKNRHCKPQRTGLTKEQRKIYSNLDNDPRGDWAKGDYRSKWTKTQRPNLYYAIIHPKTKENIFPDTYSSSPRVWGCSEETHLENEKNNLVWWGKNGLSKEPKKKRFFEEHVGMNIRSVWEDAGTNDQASQLLRDLFGLEKVYSNPKPPPLIEKLMNYSLNEDEIILDFFAGSGITGHAVINLNREDGGQRKFILAEMADYFKTVLLPRIQKVMYTPQWKDGKPERLPIKEEIDRTPRMVKVLRLESYEDALHNLVTDETLRKEEPRARAHKEKLGQDNYRLNYLARLPLESSASMLNLSALEHPFQYKLEVLTEHGPRTETADLVETFNFLYGLHVERLETWINEKDKRNYRAVKGRNREGRRVLILWRDMEGFDPGLERRFLESKLKGEGPFEEILINGDSATPGIKSLDGLFKRLMEEGEQ